MLYKTGKAIELVYQATKSQTGLTDVTMVIYDESHALDGVNFPDVVMTELGSTGRYYGSFTPDAVGHWTVLVDSATKSGPVVKAFEVGSADAETISSDIASLNDLSSSDITSVLSSYDVATVGDVTGQPMLG